MVQHRLGDFQAHAEARQPCREGPAQVTQPPAAPGRPGLRGPDEAGGDRVTSMVLASRAASHIAYGGDGTEQTDFSLPVTIAAALCV